MGRWVVLSLVVLVAIGSAAWLRLRSPAAGPPLDAPRTGSLATHNSAGRSGAYFLPAGYANKPLPLAVALHGTGSNGATMVGLLREQAERRSFIVVAPDSGFSPKGQATWEVGDHPGEVTGDFVHIERCVTEVLSMPGVRIDTVRTLVLGHSGGGSTAPYVASNADRYGAFAVLHGGVFPGGLGPRRVRGWFSTGDRDDLRPARGVESAADSVRRLGFDDVEYRVFQEGHEVGAAELDALIGWWLDR